MKNAWSMQSVEPHGPLKERRLLQFERRLGRSLPPAYRQFLLDCNGGIPRQPPADEVGTPMYELFALYDQAANDDSILSLDAALADLRAETNRRDVVPIGQDLGGNYLCLELSGQGAGKVFFYDHELEDFVPSADDFRQLLEWIASGQPLVD